MRLPWDLETVVLSSPLTVEECRTRLSVSTLAWHKPPCPAVFPVRGLVRTRRFYLGRSGGLQTPPRTWVRGRLLDGGSSTVVDLTIGPNPVLGSIMLALFSLLLAGTLLASWLAVSMPGGSWRLAGMSWVTVLTYAGLFWVLPALDYPRERRYLLRFLERTIDAVPAAGRELAGGAQRG